MHIVSDFQRFLGNYAHAQALEPGSIFPTQETGYKYTAFSFNMTHLSTIYICRMNDSSLIK